MPCAQDAALTGYRHFETGLACNGDRTGRKTVKLSIKVVPGSSREDIAGWLGGELKVRVRQAPEAGKANDAVRRLLAKTLQLSVDDIRIVSGAASPHKTIEISGVSERELRSRLPAEKK